MKTKKNESTPPAETRAAEDQPPAVTPAAAPPALPSAHAARLDAMALALEAGDLAGATTAAGGQDEDLPPSHDFDADPVAVGVILGLTLAEVEDDTRPGVLDYPMILGLRTTERATGTEVVEAIWLGAHLEATWKRIAGIDRAMPDRRSRNLDWRDHVAEAGQAWAGVPVVLYNYGTGPAERGKNPPRLFRVKTFLELRGLAGADLARFCDLWRAAVAGQAGQAGNASPKNSTSRADAAL